jgi:myo-inositol 2-dehydrogenase / D-chiro-inositol 1-dehydrogenase
MPEPAEPVRVGIVGTGVMGHRHARAWAQLGLRPVAFQVRRPRSPLAGFEDVPLVEELDAFLDAVDVVDICTPTDTHPAFAHAAAAAGRATMCEKPLALGADAAQAIVDDFAARGVPFQVSHFLRFHPHYRRLAELVEAGAIGRPIAVRASRLMASPVATRPWFADTARSGGVLSDLMIHDLDVAAWIGGPVTGLDAMRTEGVDATAFALLRHASGVVSRVECSWSYPRPTLVSELEVVGDAGVVHYAAATGRGVLRTADRETVWADEPVEHEDVVRAECANLLALRAGDPDAIPTAALGVEAVRLVERARDAADAAASTSASDASADRSLP